MKIRVIQYDGQGDYELEVTLPGDHWISVTLNEATYQLLKEKVNKPEQRKSYGN